MRSFYQDGIRVLQIAGLEAGAQASAMDLAGQLHALERAITRLGVRVIEEELPEEAVIDGGLCRLGGEIVLYVSPKAPPWKRASVLLSALRQLPNDDVWLPPEIRRVLEREDCGPGPDRLLGWFDEAKG